MNKIWTDESIISAIKFNLRRLHCYQLKFRPILNYHQILQIADLLSEACKHMHTDFQPEFRDAEEYKYLKSR